MIIQLTDTFRIFLSNHAILQIEKRKIQISWIKEAFINPIKIESDPKDSQLKWTFGKVRCQDGSIRVLKVIYKDGVPPFKVITLHFDRKAKRKLL
ncbi:MAG: DUF4258 domain-containing protein [Cyanobacteria bacterium]|jgi:hypothetical protein|nr:DUF4258 domain-containing protein [Cyanobacteria bacterium GSL.Bin1]